MPETAPAAKPAQEQPPKAAPPAAPASDPVAPETVDATTPAVDTAAKPKPARKPAAVPVPSVHTGSWHIEAVLGGGRDDARIAFIPTGRVTLSKAGVEAVLNQVAAYVASRDSITAGFTATISHLGGGWSLRNSDVAAEHLALTSLLAQPQNNR